MCLLLCYNIFVEIYWSLCHNKSIYYHLLLLLLISFTQKSVELSLKGNLPSTTLWMFNNRTTGNPIPYRKKKLKKVLNENRAIFLRHRFEMFGQVRAISWNIVKKKLSISLAFRKLLCDREL